MGNRYGLLMSADVYDDSLFSRVGRAASDLSPLAQILERSDAGGFQLTTLHNESRSVIESEITRLFRKRERDDTLLLYYSGLGVLDDAGAVYLAVRETERDFPDVTAISGHFISRLMDKSGSANIVILLDCAFIGATSPGANAFVPLPVNVANVFHGSGYGRGVLTATDQTNYRWTGEQIYGNNARFPLTERVIAGLQAGVADVDGDGRVTDRDLFTYLTNQSTPTAVVRPPQFFTFQRDQDIVIAHNPLALSASAGAIAATPPTPTATIVATPKATEQTPNRQTVFVNYGGDDKDKAMLIADLLESAGYRVWVDQKVLEGSDNWKIEIDRGLRGSFVMVALLTKSSVAPEREWAHYEQRQAIELFLPIVPLVFEECDLPEGLKRINYIDFREVNDKAKGRLLRAVERHVLRQGAQLFDEAPIMDRPFVGRGEELRRLHAAITSDDLDATQSRPTIAIHGLAGSGKTMLLRELTRRLGRQYPGGVIYEQRGETSLSTQAVLRRWLGTAIAERVDRDVTPQEVRAKLQEYGQLLVAFDDVWAEDFPDVKILIDALPADTTRLLTTQFRDEALAIGCEVFPLENPLEKMSDDDALHFLKDRLRGKGPMPADDVLLRLAHAVDNHPLALEISAGQCQYTGDLVEVTDELTRDLDEGVSALRYRNLMKVNASTSVTMSFDRSLRALDAWDHQFGTTYVREFHALGIFPDNVPLTREIIGVTWDLEQSRRVTEALSALIDRALLIRDVQGAANYRIHPLVRAYARELLLAIPAAYGIARQRYVRFITDQARVLYTRPQNQWDANESLVRHIIHIGRTLMTDIQHMIGERRFTELSEPDSSVSSLPPGSVPFDQEMLALTRAFVAAILPLVRERLELGDVVVWWLSAGLVAARLAQAANQVALFQRDLGIWYSRHSQYESALSYLSSALALARQTNDRYLLAETLREYGTAQALSNDVNGAIQSHTEALEIHRQLGEPENIADAVIDLGHDHWLLAEGGVALKMYDEALRVNPHLSARALDHIGAAYYVMSDFDRAIHYFGQAITRARQEGTLRWEAETSNDMGAALIGKGEYQEALPHLRRATELYARVGDRRVEAIAYSNCATCLRKLGQLDEATRSDQRALDIAHEIHAAKAEVWAMEEMGLICQERQQFNEARAWFADALRIFTEAHIDDKRTEAGVLGNFGWLLFVGFAERALAETYTAQALRLLMDNGLVSAQSHLSVEELRRRLDIIHASQAGDASA
jgi:tetratricopeptide (TPR) repeat protein